MVKYSRAELDATFAALSDATRRGILARLARGETSVSELAAPYEMSLPAVSKHLRVLERARLVKRRKDGRVHRCTLAPEPMKDAAAWIAHYRQFWEAQFEALERYLKEPERKEKQTWPQQSKSLKRYSKSGGRSRRRGRRFTGRGPNSRG